MTQTTPPRHLVVYADDDRDDIFLVEEAFSSTTDNIELVVAYNGQDALSFLDSRGPLDPDPCLIILDVNMPLLNGRDTLVHLRQRERYKNTPVVLFTTSSMPQDKQFAERHGAGFITKPLNTEQMNMITEQFIDHCADEVKKSVRKRII